MGFLKLLQKEKKTHSLGVCIPSHEKERIDIEIAKVQSRAEEEAKKNSVENTAFELDGYYEVMGTAMLSGRVVKGSITKKKKILLNDKEYKVKEIQRAQQDVNRLDEGERGAIFIKGRGLLVQSGQVIEIK